MKKTNELKQTNENKSLCATDTDKMEMVFIKFNIMRRQQNVTLRLKQKLKDSSIKKMGVPLFTESNFFTSDSI